tara:strand:+ start:235 stop:402 length:168 start_codon:yes stop_codon:yes gene_type:complete
MKYFTASTKYKLKLIIDKLNNQQPVSLSERILLNKYSDKAPYLITMIKEHSLKFS